MNYKTFVLLLNRVILVAFFIIYGRNVLLNDVEFFFDVSMMFSLSMLKCFSLIYLMETSYCDSRQSIYPGFQNTG